MRISEVRRQFKRGYLPSWTEELFTVCCVTRTIPITYVLKDDHSEELLCTFYQKEIQKVGSAPSVDTLHKLIPLKEVKTMEEGMVESPAEDVD